MEEARISEFIDKFSPAMAAEIRECRAKMRTLIGNGYELVFDNYNALVFGFSPTERSSHARISIAAYPRCVTLFFLNGVSLDDPHGLLQGDGKQVRGIRLTSPADLDRAEITDLVVAALAEVRDAMNAVGEVKTIIKSVSEKQRPRR